MSRIEVGYGAGQINVLYHLADGGNPIEYNDQTAEGLHNRYGGERYYTAQSGLSGAGWFPQNPALIRLTTMRVDRSLRSPSPEPAFAGYRIVAFTNRKGSSPVGNTTGPLAVIPPGYDADQNVYLMWGYDLPAFLREEIVLEGMSTTSLNLTSWNSAPGRRREVMEEKTLGVRVHRLKGVNPPAGLSARKIAESMFWQELRPVGNYCFDGPARGWHNRLGLAYGPDGRLYYSGNGVLRRPLDGQVTTENMAEIAPWVIPIDDDTYMTPGASSVTLHNRRDDGIDMATSITPRLAVLLMTRREKALDETKRLIENFYDELVPEDED